MNADEIITELGLEPHPEGGFYRETWRDPLKPRGHGTAIYYLLPAGVRSHWHRVDATELWHFYLGSPMELRFEYDGHVVQRTLGTRLTANEAPQITIPKGAWQSAESTGAFTLVGCTVSPAFEFSGFEMAPPGWEPG